MCSLLGDDDFFSKLAEEAENDEDIDDMDADLFGSKKKPSSAPAQIKGSGIGGPTKNPPKSGNKLKGGGISDEPDIEEKKPSSAPASTARGYKRFSFTNFDDPLADLLDDLPIEDKNEPKIIKKAPPEKSVLPPDSPIIKKQVVPKKRDELTFDDDEDDLMDALGFGESPKESLKKNETVLIPKNESSSELPQRARTRLDEILGRGTSPRLLERPLTGERKDPPQQQENQKHHQETPTTKDSPLRTTVPLLLRRNPNPSPPRSLLPFPGLLQTGWGRSQDDDDEEEEKEEPPPVPEPLKTPSSSVGSKPSSSGNRIPQPSTKTPNTSFKSPKPVGPSVEVSASQKDKDDWLSGALSRKKTESSTRSEEKRTTQKDVLGFGDEVDLESFLSKRGSSPASRRKDASTPNKEPGEPSHRQPSPTAHSTPVREDQFRPVPQQSQMQNTAPVVQPQVSHSANRLQQLLLQQQQFESQLLGLGGAVDVAGLQRQKRETEKQNGHLALQARIIKLEGQVRSLQLELDQNQMLLESVQQRHDRNART
eukprot:XP_014058990.1 PREDICTED: fas-binding factor 1 homolog [Salmo salar]